MVLDIDWFAAVYYTYCLLLGSDNDPNWVVSKAVFPSDSVSVATALHVGFNLSTRGSGDTGRSCFFCVCGGGGGGY